MAEGMFAFLIWSAVGLLLIGIGVHAFFAKKPQHFWANAPMIEVNDVKKYNRAVGKLFIAFGAAFTLTGLPLLMENKMWILLSMLLVMPVVIVTMVIYTTVIEKKYKRK